MKNLKGMGDVAAGSYDLCNDGLQWLNISGRQKRDNPVGSDLAIRFPTIISIKQAH